MADGVIGSVAVSVVPSTKGFWEEFVAKTKGEAEDAGRIEGEKFRRGFDETAGRNTVKVKVDADTSKARAEMQNFARQSSSSLGSSKRDAKLLQTAIVSLAPAAVTAAGGVVAIGAAFGGLAVTGVLAFKGIQSQMAQGTALGQKFTAMVTEAKGVLGQADSVAAHGVFPGMSAALAKLNADLPRFNDYLSQSSTQLGGIVNHLTGGLVGGFNTFEPLLLRVQGYASQLAGVFEKWATGPGGASFGRALGKDLDALVPTIQALAPLVVHFASALNSVGAGSLGILTQISSLLSHIPTPVIEAATVAYIGFRTAVAATAGIEAASAALARLAGAEATVAGASAAGAASRGLAATGGAAAGAAVSSGRMAGALTGVSGGLAAIASKAVPIIAIGYALNRAGAATRDWMTSTNGLERTVGSLLQVFDTLPWHLADVYHAADAQIEQIKAIRALYGKAPADVAGVAKAMRAVQAQMVSLGSRGSLVDAYEQLDPTQSAAAQAAYTNLKHFLRDMGSAFHGYYDQQATFAKRSHATILNALDQSGAISTSAQQFAGYQKQIQKNIDIESKWTAHTVFNAVTVHTATGDIVVSAKTAAAAYAASGDSVAKAAGLIEAHYKALQTDKAAQEQVTVGLARISRAYALTNATVTTSTHGMTSAGKEQQATIALTTQQIDTYAAVLGITARQLFNGTISARQFAGAIHNVKNSVDNGNTATQSWITALLTFDKAGDTAASRAALMGQAMVSLQGDSLTFQGAVSQAAAASHGFAQSIRSAASQVGKSGEPAKEYLKRIVDLKTGTIDYTKAASAPLIAALQQEQASAMNAAAATYQHEVATKGARQATQDAEATFTSFTQDALVKQATQLGLTGKQAKTLADTYFKWPKNAKTEIAQIGGDKVTHMLAGILGDLDKLVGVHHGALTFSDNGTLTYLQRVGDALRTIQGGHVVSVSYQTPNGTVKASARGSRATFGTPYVPPNTVSTVGEAGYEGLITDSMGRASILSNAQAKAAGIRPGGPLPGFAKGTVAPTAANYFRAFLQGLGAPTTSSNLRALYGVSTLEGWNNRYNPLNVIQPEPGSSAYNSVGVQTYPDLATGVKGALDLFRRNGVWDGVIAALRNGKSISGVLDAFKRVYAGWDPGVQFPIVSMSAGNTRIGPKGGSIAGIGGITVGHVGGKKVWQFNGHNYASLAAAENAQASASQSATTSRRSNALSAANSLIGGIGSRPSSQLNVEQTGIGLVERQINDAQKRIANMAHLKPKDRAKLEGDLAKLVHEAQRQFDRLKLHIRKADLKDMRKALLGTVADVRAAFRQTVGDLRKIGAAEPLIARLQRREEHVIKAVRDRNQAERQLAALNARAASFRASVGSAITGSFDITQAGVGKNGAVRGGLIVAQEVQSFNRDKRFVKDLKELENRGYPRSYIEQLAQAGPSVIPQLEGLLSLGKGQQARLISTEQKISDLSGRAGGSLGEALFGSRREQLRNERDAAAKIARNQAEIIADRIDHALSHWTLKMDGNGLLHLVRTAERKADRRGGVPGGRHP